MADTLSSVYIMLDALDECSSATLQETITLIRRFKDSRIKVFCTLRPNLIDLGDWLGVPSIHTIRADDKDVRNYLSIRLNKEWRHAESLREKVIDGLTKDVEGKSVSLSLYC